MLESLINQAKPMIMQKLSLATGLTGGAADGFINKAKSMFEGLLKSGNFDVASLISGGPGALINKLNLGELSGLVGGSVDKAKAGATAVADGVFSQLKADPGAAQNLIQQLTAKGGGILGGLGDIASGILGGKKP